MDLCALSIQLYHFINAHLLEGQMVWLGRIDLQEKQFLAISW